ncbi:MAG: NAD(P)H-hydrate dehydratase [Candidatus Methanoperedens sp.]|nr:NAD(P)H-hydrate dehydratase [Candidatus Methanoperedens sp.]PKL53410.1 MAG: bifunctional ADP-dependent NAD(P)H-hydrate dehydratase/NAD(P)H-hydrate epimerase [Candidatus Methanoperedenaceae archaeon HGW-Methanoperedenaceae-1]
MDAITSSRMAAIDVNCEYLGIKSLQLMENAGAGVAGVVREKKPEGKIIIIAGKGNNGGDAFVTARHLKGMDVTVILIGKKDDIKTQEAKHNWKALEKTSIPLHQVTDPAQLPALLKDAGIIIDGIFGTGIKGIIREPESTAIDLINASGAYVISIDVPSGFDPDGGDFDKSVRANLTATFHKMKVGLLPATAREYTGGIQVIDIGIPPDAEFFVGKGDIKPFMERQAGSHKGDSGRVLIIGGGAYSGAPALSALAALRAGADIVTVAAPKSVSGIIASFSPNLIVHALSGKRLSVNHIPEISRLIEKHDVVVMGMGLGTSGETVQAVREIIPLCKKLVLDADALITGLFPVDDIDIIITPHAGEMKRLSGVDVPVDNKDKADFVRDFASNNNVTVLLKGAVDIISDGVEVRANMTGNAGMTVGGTGDVLAGITGALFARGDALSAACAAAFINGAGGDMAFEEVGYGLLATDIIDNIAGVMKI